MGNEFDREQLVSIFVAEAADDMATLRAVLHPADGADPAPGDLERHHTIGHKLKGAALLYGFPGLGKLGELLETLLEDAAVVSKDRWPPTVALLRAIVDRFRAQIEVIKQDGSDDGECAADLEDRATGLRSNRTAEGQEPEAPVSDVDVMPALDEEVLSYFVPEVEEYLDTISNLLQRLQKDGQDSEVIHHLFRVAHTLKGSAYTVGFQVIGDVAHPIETCMIAAREGRARVTPRWISCFQRAVQVIRALVKRDADRTQSLRQEVPSVLSAMRELEMGGDDAPATATSVVETPAPAEKHDQPVAAGASEEPALSEDYLVPDLDAEVLSYFAPEAQEYLDNLEAFLLRLEKESHNPDIIHQLFRTAHTLKGSAYTVGFQSIGDLTHHIEDFMGAVREGRLQVLPGHTDLLLRAIDVIRTLMRRDPANFLRVRERFSASLRELKRLEQAQQGATEAPAIPSEAAYKTEEGAPPAPAAAEAAQGGESKSPEDREVIRVSRDRLERLLNLVGELVIDRGRLEQRLRVLERLSQQVLANKIRLIDAVRSFEEKHTFSFQ
ncbi:MAG TPA: Hpt domain-containing protein, partial [Nitrospiraceae bacterium]|nr:Hpt domain-containing protein [Nitrospiraceae bacterium]